MDGFVIDQISWYKGQAVNQDVPGRFRALAGFLQDNGLAVRPLLPAGGAELPDDFAVRSNDLTADGMALVKAAYQKWVKAIDRGKPATDVSLLRKELDKIRAAGPNPGTT